jgi:hypothetical protein
MGRCPGIIEVLVPLDMATFDTVRGVACEDSEIDLVQGPTEGAEPLGVGIGAVMDLLHTCVIFGVTFLPIRFCAETGFLESSFFSIN